MDSDVSNSEKEKGIKKFKDLFCRKKASGSGENATEEEIMSIVSEGTEKGDIRSSEARMLKNVLHLDDKSVKDIMVHRNDIVSLDGNTSLGDAIRFFQEKHFSRIPVYLGSIDRIIGIIHIKEMLNFATRPHEFRRKIRDIDGLIRPAETVPETHGIHTLFTAMQMQKSHMALVVDEYGQTSGLVSMEDILEEIVGNIEDEHDDFHDTVEPMQNGYMMEGRTPLSEVSRILGASFEKDDIETLNGLLICAYGKVPDEHEKFSIKLNGFLFRVLDVENRVIKDVRVVRLPQHLDDEAMK